APVRIISLEHPAANRLSLNFFFTLDTSISDTLFDGRIRAAAQISPVNSSAAKSTFSISCTGSTSLHTPYPWEQTDDSPVFFLLSISEFLCIPAHNSLHGNRMTEMKLLLIISF